MTIKEQVIFAKELLGENRAKDTQAEERFLTYTQAMLQKTKELLAIEGDLIPQQLVEVLQNLVKEGKVEVFKKIWAYAEEQTKHDTEK